MLIEVNFTGNKALVRPRLEYAEETLIKLKKSNQVSY